MNAQELFEQNGLNAVTSEDAMDALNELDVVELWDLAESLIEDNGGIESTGDEDTDCLVLRAALLDALENGSEALTQEDFDRARERAVALSEDEDGEADTVEASAEDEDSGASVEDTPEADEDAEAATVEASDEDSGEDVDSEADTVEASADGEPATPKRRGRRPSSAALAHVKAIVSDNPELVKDEVVEQAMNTDGVDVSESTLVLYFYKARTELGLPTNGKRGRPQSDKWSEIVNLVQANPDADRATVVQQIHDQFDVAESTATNYYHKAQRELSAE